MTAVFGPDDMADEDTPSSDDERRADAEIEMIQWLFGRES